MTDDELQALMELEDRFERETGMIAPGRDVPAVRSAGRAAYETRRDAWRKWLSQQVEKFTGESSC